MGLDIYARFNHQPCHDDEDAWVYYKHGGDWSDREEGAPDGPHTSETADHACMSYGSYSEWRRAMAKAYLNIGLPASGEWPAPADVNDPLWKLIWYADNEGVFGPPMVKLVAERLKGLDDTRLDDDVWQRCLRDWRDVFVEAAAHEDGCVEWA